MAVMLQRRGGTRVEMRGQEQLGQLYLFLEPQRRATRMIHKT